MRKNKNTKERPYTSRMLIGGLMGFLSFAAVGVLFVFATGQIKSIDNPYVGPPPIMTVLVFGFFGIVIGALISLLRRPKGNN